MVDQRNPENISYECQMEKTLQKLHDVVQLRQKLLLERATLKSQLDKLLQRSVNDVDLIVGDDDDYDDVDVDGGGSSTGGGGVGQTQSSNCQLQVSQLSTKISIYLMK
ncbi:RIMS binding protein, variant 2 [Schistosoma haematobium]|uniref:RIMS binding protein, variant 2 n=1 Tax=Schistosoma haematobium TaxID=6185 RepID=A0A922LJC1_SCHHA|nr:RIMS binding protein, variant 2 [Schistosoma haematobium]KAH9586920.1 RIMS binding protein, variant 2 [Schistosoma haematobium]